MCASFFTYSSHHIVVSFPMTSFGSCIATSSSVVGRPLNSHTVVTLQATRSLNRAWVLESCSDISIALCALTRSGGFRRSSSNVSEGKCPPSRSVLTLHSHYSHSSSCGSDGLSQANPNIEPGAYCRRTSQEWSPPFQVLLWSFERRHSLIIACQ